MQVFDAAKGFHIVVVAVTRENFLFSHEHLIQVNGAVANFRDKGQGIMNIDAYPFPVHRNFKHADLCRNVQSVTGFDFYRRDAFSTQCFKSPFARGKQLFFFYAWQRGKGTDQLPGIGPTDFTPWIAALSKVGYAGYVNPFMHGELETEQMSAALVKSRFAPDFRNWKRNNDKFEAAFEKLVQALRADQGAREQPPEPKL